MDTKDIVVFFVLLLCYSLILIKCVGNELSKVARELADTQNELLRKLPGELLVNGQLKRNVRQADEDTDMLSATEILSNALTEIIEMKLVSYMDCNKNEYNHTKCTLKPGPKGEPGDTGPPGPQGIVGQRGPVGPKGLQGPVGRPGKKGTKGELGDMGLKGEPGIRGMQGNVGYTGFKGEKGREGVVGPPGPSGSEGPPGIQGKDGSKGEQGVVGAKGDMGERGLKGDMGPPGPRGETGERGNMGQKGEAGMKGVKGIQGHTGYKGEKGQKGVAGPQGPPGPPTAPPTTAPPTTPSPTTAPPTTPPPTTAPPTTPPPTTAPPTTAPPTTAPVTTAPPTTAPVTTAPPTTAPPTTAPPTTAPIHCGGPGWRRVVFLKMTNTSHVCPAGLNLTTYSRRTCGRASSGYYTCSSTTFSVGGSQYSRVCGRALAYRFSRNYAFYGYHSRQGIDGQYVDGLSLTHGAPGSRQHIWTFASGLFTRRRSSSHSRLRCPCDNGNTTYRSPPFVGNDYFCESVTQSTWATVFYPDALLWDGQVCEGGGTCCQFNNPPWFTKNLANSTTEDIELRLCLTETSQYADMALELLELYVQ